MDAEGCKKLHEAINEGKLNTVKDLLKNHVEGQGYFHSETSALRKAISCKKYDIIAYLIFIRANIKRSEIKDSYLYSNELEEINHHLKGYEKENEKSWLDHLKSSQKFQEGQVDQKQKEVLESMYEALFGSVVIKYLMRVLKGECYTVTYDFLSDYTDNINLQHIGNSGSHGLTDIKRKHIYIGAKDLLSKSESKQTRVHGVVAEELCHLAMEILFENEAKPYRMEDYELEKEFGDIVESVKKLYFSHPNSEFGDVVESVKKIDSLHEVIQRVFKNYREQYRVSELIARVPHIIGMYGEEEGRKQFKKNPALSKLLEFYDKNVLTQCKNPLLDSRAYQKMRNLIKDNELIPIGERSIRPLNKKIISDDHLVKDENGFYIIRTNCTKLCTFELYNDLKEKYQGQLLNKCLYFSREGLEKNLEEIKEGLKHMGWEYHILKSKGDKIFNEMKETVWENLIIVMDKREFYPKTFYDHFIFHFEDFMKKGLKVIIISSSQSLPKKSVKNPLNYEWNDLSDDYKDFCSARVKWVFKGVEQKVPVKKENVEDDFSEEDIIKIINGECFKVDDAENFVSVGYNRNTYVERLFRTDYRSKTSSNTKKKDEEQKCITEDGILKVLERESIIIISDNAGYGKSTAISSLITQIKERNDFSLIVRVDFGKVSSKDIPLKYNGEEENKENELLRLLKLNKGIKKCFFRNFNSSCYVFLDAFDELFSEMKFKILELLSFLREKKDAKIIITTRKHLQKDLEVKLNTYSHEFVPFNEESQTTCLGLLWKWKLNTIKEKATENEKKGAFSKKIKSIIEELNKGTAKSVPEYQELKNALEKINLNGELRELRSEIEDLNLTEIAKRLLKNTLLDEETQELIGIPLHLFMIGTIHYSHNFNAEKQLDFYTLYSSFIEQKIKIYMEEKLNYKESERKKNEEKITKKTYRIHSELAEQLVDRGKVCFASAMVDKEFCTDLGIVYKRDEEVLFIHQTFAEYFKAESLRKNMQRHSLKVGLTLSEILFESKYKVVRRFLAGALDKGNFENLTKEFFESKQFLYSVLEIVPRAVASLPTLSSTSDILCIVKILKSLLEAFEKIAEPYLVDKFIQTIEKRLKDGCSNIGSFLSVHMIINLIKRNFVANSVIVLEFLRFAENEKEVRLVLGEFISIDKAESLSKLLNPEGSAGFFHYAALNERTDFLLKTYVFENILTVVRDELGKDQFLEIFKKSCDMNFIHLIMKNIPTKLIRTLNIIKERIEDVEWFKQLLQRKGEYSRNILQLALLESIDLEALLIFCDPYIDKKEIQEMLLSLDEYGGNAIHFLVCKTSSEYMRKILKLLDKFLGNAGDFKLKDLLRSKDIYSRNIFQLTLSEGRNLEDLLTICDFIHFGEIEIQQMLLSQDKDGDNAIHYLVAKTLSEFLMENLKLLEGFFKDGDLVKDLLKSKNKCSMNIFQIAFSRDTYLKDFFQYCYAHLEKAEIEGMLTSFDIEYF